MRLFTCSGVSFRHLWLFQVHVSVVENVHATSVKVRGVEEDGDEKEQEVEDRMSYVIMVSAWQKQQGVRGGLCMGACA